LTRLIDDLRNRRTIFLRKPLLAQFQLYVGGPVKEYIDSEVEELIRRKKVEWSSQGIPERFIRWAIDMAREWAESIADFHLRTLKDIVPEDELKKIGRELVLKLYRQGLDEVAKKWLEVMTGKSLR
jgi:hypothetical protein